MKFMHYLSLISLITAGLFITPINAKPHKGDNNARYRQENEKRNTQQQSDNKNNDGKSHRYEYRGQYKNFNDNNHQNRYYYHGNYYNFHDYYTYYKTEDNSYTYEGPYERHGNIFIFSDRYGNEFDLYVKPVSAASRWFKGYRIYPGDTYDIRVSPARMYPAASELRTGINFSFGWGNLTLQNNQYFDMYTAPELVNVNGQLFMRR